MTANRVDKLLVTTGAEQATVAALTVGDYIVLVDGAAANTPVDSKSVFTVAVKSIDGNVKYADKIKGSDIKSFRLSKYKAPVNQVTTLTLSTPVAGIEYIATIVEKSDKDILQRRQDKRTYTQIAANGETATTLADKFKDLINADQDVSVVATSAAGVLTLTAKAVSATAQDADGQFKLQKFFDASIISSGSGIQWEKASTVATTVKPSFGNGTFAEVRTLEMYSAGYDGNLNRMLFPVIPPVLNSNPTKTYDIITIEYDNNYWSNSVVSGKVDSPVTLVLAVEAGNTTDLEAVFADFL